MKYEMDRIAKLEGTRWRERKVLAGDRGVEREEGPGSRQRIF